MHTLAGIFIVMKYQKTAKTYEEQADLLISRKMMGIRSSIIKKLSAVNYYRLSGYWQRILRGIRRWKSAMTECSECFRSVATA